MLKFSTYEELLENEGLKKKAAKSGVSYGTLKKVYNRGMAAWKTGHRPGTTPQQWGMARVNSYITKGKGTYHGADKDLRDDVQYEAHDPKHVKQAIGIASDPRYKKGNMTGAVKAMNKISKDIHKHPQVAAVLRRQNESKVNEISKTLAKNYLGKAARDMYHKGQQQATADAISKLGGPNKSYKKSPERKAAMRVRGMDRATNRLMKKEAKRVVHSDKPDSLKSIKVITPKTKKNEAMSDAEKAAHQKAIDAFKAKGGKIKKLAPGYAQGYHGKADPAAGMKGMMDKGDTKSIGTRKKVGSMR